MAEISIADVTKVEIHPAIGIARVGGSDEFFIGPEVPGAVPEPPGNTLETKFKDAQGRVKRQAARFRCFGYDDHGKYVDLSGKAEVTVNWEVTLANKKAAALEFPDGAQRRNPGQQEKDLIIAPGSRGIVGKKTATPPAPVAFDNGRVKFTLDNVPKVIDKIYLGELRTDEDGRLLVLGGRGVSQHHPGAELTDTFNSPNWCDDVSDGPVKAEVAITVGGAERKFTAEPAWVIVTPPKFAPEAESPTSLWDQIMHAFGVKAPARPSYVHDIFPILQSPRTMKGVSAASSGHHGWRHPVIDEATRRRVFKRIGDPSKNGTGGTDSLMPKLTELAKEYPSLTPRQYEIMKKWREGTFENDWKAEWGNDRPPFASFPITPDGLDRAALHACVGAAFYPGIEGGRFLIEKKDGKPKNWKTPYPRLRFAAHVKPGDVTARMAVPWQADFYACGPVWWPAPRPNEVVPRNKTNYVDWDRNVAVDSGMVNKWWQLGYVLRDADGRWVEVARSLRSPTPLELTRVAHKVSAAVSGPEPLWPDAGRLAADLAGAAVLSFGQATAEAERPHTWPLWLTELDEELTVEVRGADLDRLEVRLAPPLGPPLAPGDFGVGTSRADGRVELRVELPFHVQAGRYTRAGLWQVEVRADRETTYQLAATARSLITFPAVTTAGQDGSISARVDFTGAPISDGTAVVQPLSPERELEEVALRSEGASGAKADRVAGDVALQKAEYLRIQVTGTSPMGHPFVRERLLRTSDLP
ncbi:LodA/GoxA family CTQ-dependent oxidase [Actinomadura chibensis]|uniref:Uncharacterized protein n=1 Tax=Actinomadura chibensis TaxID=392828 RepID=A0A5D0NIZ6_9ACTN|nr:LodA/GoxA family CTQ-dependent oxidase [Actinomadura chibensis]TYB44171.1 hypothetical protein FXF69_24785 [Actinomadura chibensis]